MRNREFPSLIVLMALFAFAPLHASAVTKSKSPERRVVGPDLVVAEAIFGYVDPKTGEIIEADRIDTSTHKGFGWRIRFEGTRQTVRFEEEFILPAPAKTWQVGNETQVAPDGASALTRGERALGRSMVVRNAWFHSPGDPRGRHVTRVSIEGVLIKQFEFVLY